MKHDPELTHRTSEKMPLHLKRAYMQGLLAGQRGELIDTRSMDPVRRRVTEMGYRHGKEERDLHP